MIKVGGSQRLEFILNSFKRLSSLYDTEDICLFIFGFRLKYLETEYFFLNGGCYIFAKLLQNLFGGEIVHYKQHYILKLNSKYYDITGEVKISKSEKESFIKELKKDNEVDRSMKSGENIMELVLYDLMTTYLQKNKKFEE